MTHQDNTFIKRQGFINNQWLSSAAQFTVMNPATEQVICHVADFGSDETHEAIEAAEAAFGLWKDQSVFARATVLRRWAVLIRDHLDELAPMTTLEQGRPIKEARQEWLSGASALDWFASEAERIHGRSFPGGKNDPIKMTIMQPIGVVAAITPWNFSVLSVVVKAGAAIAAGCTVVLKPSELTPLGALAIARLAEMAQLPAGVFNVLPTSNPEPIGALFSQDSRISTLSFTGSALVGRKLAGQAGGTIKKVELELGGNAPFIVFDDADMEKACRDLMGARFFNNGQICVGANRVYLHKRIESSFLDLFLTHVQGLRVGNGLERSTNCGPLINDKAQENMLRLVNDAVSQGAHILCGGKAVGDAPGYFFPPTVVAGVTETMALRNEEIFGPIVAISTFNDDEAVTRLANSTLTGLAAYFYTSNASRQHQMMQRLKAGMVGCNTTNIFDARLGFGGCDQSGHGREGGMDALRPYLIEKNCFIA